MTLAKTFGHIQDLNRHIAAQTLTQDQVDSRTLKLSRQLSDWEYQLPEHIRPTAPNIEQHRLKSLGGTLIDMYLGFHHYSTFLYFNHLSLRHGKQTRNPDFYRSCKSHAVQYSDLLRVSRQEKGCEAVYATVGHMTIVSSAVLVFCSCSGITRRRQWRERLVTLTLLKFMSASDSQ